MYVYSKQKVKNYLIKSGWTARILIIITCVHKCVCVCVAWMLSGQETEQGAVLPRGCAQWVITHLVT